MEGLVNEVGIEQKGWVAWITIHRPARRNALGRATIQALLDVVVSLRDGSGVRAVVFVGSNGHFCSGADLKERLEMSGDDRLTHSRSIARLVEAVAALPMPTIAAIDGYALGGGLELALACDIRILSRRAVVGLPEVRRGIFPASGGTQRLARLVGSSVAKEMLFTGKHIDASEALRVGLANSISEPEGLLAAASELTQAIAQNGPLAVKAAKRVVEMGLDIHLAGGLRYEDAEVRGILKSHDYQEGLCAFAEGREARFIGE